MNIIIAGDFCPRARTSKIIENGNYKEIFAEVKNIIELSDFSIVNLECPVVLHGNYAPIPKSGPNLKCDKRAIEALKYAGFKAVSLANNHIYDYGDNGLKDTFNTTSALGISIVGAGSSLVDASKFLITEINNQRLAIINCCEHEFSIAKDNSFGANPLNPIDQYYQIKEAKKHADYVIVIVHGGHEHYQLPSPRMQEVYRFFVECGADSVINHHQHCYSGYEIYKEKPIFYGLGNFCFDHPSNRSSLWTEGYMVELVLEDKVDFRLLPYIQCKDDPSIQLLKNNNQFDDVINKLNEIIVNPILLKNKHREWLDSLEKRYLVSVSPYSDRYTRNAAFKGYIPMGLPKKKIIDILNCVDCEAHRDGLLYILKKML